MCIYIGVAYLYECVYIYLCVYYTYEKSKEMEDRLGKRVIPEYINSTESYDIGTF